MMNTITQLSEELQKLLTETAEEIASATQFVKRKRKLTGSAFVQGMVFGLMHEPNATRRQLHMAYSRNSPKPISAEGLDQRFREETVMFLKRMVEEGLKLRLQTQMGKAFGLLGHFKGVYVLDGTKVRVHDSQHHLLTRLNITTGEMLWQQTDQPHHENHFALTHDPLPRGALRLTDLGFYHLDTFAQLSQEGVYWLTRYKARTTLYDAAGNPLDIHTLLQAGSVDCVVQVGQERLPARLVARSVPRAIAQQRQAKHRHRAQRKQKNISTTVLSLSAWTIFLTSISDLDFEALEALAHARWQIERVFKLWKSFFRLPHALTQHPIRLMCLFWAKLLVILIAHWLMRLDPRTFPQRSLWLTAQVIQSFAFSLFDALPYPSHLIHVLDHLRDNLARSSSLSKRGSHKLTFQLLA